MCKECGEVQMVVKAAGGNRRACRPCARTPPCRAGLVRLGSRLRRDAAGGQRGGRAEVGVAKAAHDGLVPHRQGDILLKEGVRAECWGIDLRGRKCTGGWCSVVGVCVCVVVVVGWVGMGWVGGCVCGGELRGLYRRHALCQASVPGQPAMLTTRFGSLKHSSFLRMQLCAASL